MEYEAYQKAFSATLTKLDEVKFFQNEKQNRAALAIYRNNVIYSLREVLGEDFPVIKKLLGEEFFNQIAGDFVRHHLPNQADLSLYGEAFAAFLENNKALLDYPYLSDVAKIEMACRTIYYAKQETSLDAAKLQGLSDDALAQEKFSLCAATHLLELNWAADKIWHAHQHQQEAIPAMTLEPEDTFLLLCRDENHAIDIFRLAPDMALFLSKLDGALRLEEAVSAVFKKFPAFDLSNGLSLCLTKHLLQGGDNGRG